MSGGDRIAKDFSKSFYKTQAWKKCRDSFGQSKGWLCEDCLAKGIYKPGREVHHLEELTPLNITNPEVTLSWSNLRLLCHDCHMARHKEVKDRRYLVDENGEIIVL